jgi:hypothetical protein
MDSTVEILVEERSMEIFLRVILPELLPNPYVLDQNCFIRPHQGKSDLQKSIPRKVQAFKNFPQSVRLIVIHDQDSNDCQKLKATLTRLVEEKNAELPKLIRIACRELENWYLGDLTAVEKVYPDSKASSLQHKAKFRNCDKLNGSEEMLRLTKNFTKSFSAREMPQQMSFEDNKSTSFNHFITGLQRFLDSGKV